MTAPNDAARPVARLSLDQDGLGVYEDEHGDYVLFTDYDKLREEVERLREELREAWTVLSLTRTNILIELNQGRDRWDGVPDHLQARIESISAALPD